MSKIQNKKVNISEWEKEENGQLNFFFLKMLHRYDEKLSWSESYNQGESGELRRQKIQKSGKTWKVREK